MRRFIIIVLGILIMPLALFGYALLTYRRNREKASRFYDRPGYPHDDGTRLALAPIKMLEVLPLVDWYAARGDLETESGVSPGWRGSAFFKGTKGYVGDHTRSACARHAGGMSARPTLRTEASTRPYATLAPYGTFPRMDGEPMESPC